MICSIQNLLFLSVLIFTLLSVFLFIQHELHNHRLSKYVNSQAIQTTKNFQTFLGNAREKISNLRPITTQTTVKQNQSFHFEVILHNQSQVNFEIQPLNLVTLPSIKKNNNHSDLSKKIKIESKYDNRGTLICNGNLTDSEIIYWKHNKFDHKFKSPIRIHMNDYKDKFMTFEYDHGGWNNVRMGIESLIVVAHAIGRTIILPPQQHLYLLGRNHKDKTDQKAHDEMGFEDFYDLDILKSQEGLNVMEMKDFLQLVSNRRNSSTTKTYGTQLWDHLSKIADVNAAWQGKYITFPAPPPSDITESNIKALDWNLSFLTQPKTSEEVTISKRAVRFGGERVRLVYGEDLQKARHIHFPGHEPHRILQHHYAFAFFADPMMQSFYKRFIRDYMRYKDEIQCAGAELVAAVRKDAIESAKRLSPIDASNLQKYNLSLSKYFPSMDNPTGIYYAFHIRRGDMAHKIVKLPAAEIISNLHFPNGTPIIPPGSFVYISTDDPKGICEGCTVLRISCDSYPVPKPEGCPEDTTWRAFVKYGWKIRFLNDYLAAGLLKDVNPNVYGMVESIVCSRAKVFAGTYWSTFTGYIHRLRGYHGLGEDTYYHYKKQTFVLQVPEDKVHNPYGWWREWRAGWTDDQDGNLIQ